MMIRWMAKRQIHISTFSLSNIYWIEFQVMCDIRQAYFSKNSQECYFFKCFWYYLWKQRSGTILARNGIIFNKFRNIFLDYSVIYVIYLYTIWWNLNWKKRILLNLKDNLIHKCSVILYVSVKQGTKIKPDIKLSVILMNLLYFATLRD